MNGPLCASSIEVDRGWDLESQLQSWTKNRRNSCCMPILPCPFTHVHLYFDVCNYYVNPTLLFSPIFFGFLGCYASGRLCNIVDMTLI
uniref:Uncharacterized protein n=1 Tax=Rhizophora mucronata TaxID=61149 RepID=A0A2P2IUF2_RHIMU